MLLHIDLPNVFGTQTKTTKRKRIEGNCKKRDEEDIETLIRNGKSEYIQSITEIGDLTHIFSHVKHHMKVVWIRLKPINIDDKTSNDKEHRDENIQKTLMDSVGLSFYSNLLWTLILFLKTFFWYKFQNCAVNSWFWKNIVLDHDNVPSNTLPSVNFFQSWPTFSRNTTS